ncbi:NAD(P)/FAD-dependent oxidoreductase [Nocardioides caldifontis]|uniref:NAD(P)/FAD-dependent oxidoreductase n=1 Tax=Nocardioides caldifontis TaxID=2588938 RepID=UPI001EF065CE|nr:FAD-binding oxidoreductase [Nocardioides caldifontis]
MGRPLSSPAAPSSCWQSLSFWHATAGEDWTPRPPLAHDTDADVAIVGAGYTGLWTAYYLLREDPSLRVVVLEAEAAGYGASGRNGGWCSALFPMGTDRLAALPGSDREAAIALHRAMRATVDEVLAVVATEGIDADAVKGGTVSVARTPAQLQRAREELEHARSWGRGEDELRLLDPVETAEVVRLSDALGSLYTPDCATIHPAKLVRGLARTVERLGARIHERTRALRLDPGAVVTDHGTVRADVVVRATEGYTPLLAGHHRALVPVHSLVVATEPLTDEQWDRVGLHGRPTFTEQRHLVVYGQRTRDGRLVFGGRGAPYHFGSRVGEGHDEKVWTALRATLREYFPVLEDVAFTHAWGGALGVPRDWCASVGLDRRTGFAWAGGYVGDGVSTTNLAGRTLRDLVLGRDTELTRLPWVDHRSPTWEPEPLRWLGINAGLRAATVADREEALTRRPSKVAALLAPLTGH